MFTIKAKDVQMMWNVLKQTVNLSSRNWRNRVDFEGNEISKEAFDLHQFLIKRMPTLEPQQIDAIRNTLPKKFGSDDPESYIFLPPLESCELLVPVLSLNYNLNCSKDEPAGISFRVGLLNLDLKGQLRLFGLRIENGLPESNHDYCHFQFTREPFRGKITQFISDYPENWPCMVIPANEPVSLIFCTLVCFYGKTIVPLFPDFQGYKKYWEPLKNFIT
ncbi:hypothetical protein MUP77_19720 [Candidatus Bathyarchaeota archaeon]|nr:hypothetical protein [Candidatus Bathyarchaeota archaeon]